MPGLPGIPSISKSLNTRTSHLGPNDLGRGPSVASQLPIVITNRLLLFLTNRCDGNDADQGRYLGTQEDLSSTDIYLGR